MTIDPSSADSYLRAAASGSDPEEAAIFEALEVTSSYRKPSLGSVNKIYGIFILPFMSAHRIPVFKRVWLYLAIMAAYVSVVDLVADKGFPTRIIKESGAASYTPMILGLLLVFRTNAAYERWNEGRKMWGQLVNDSRNLCIKIRTLTHLKDKDRSKMGELVVSFAYALKHHLRDTTPVVNLPGVAPGLSKNKNLPVWVAGKMYDLIHEWHQQKRIDGFTLLQLDLHAKSFMDVCGACERIRNTPLAISYRAFMRQGIALNLLAVPWYVDLDCSIWWCMPLILIGTYFLIGLELIAEDIEDPFGVDGDDLPLDNICSNVKKTVHEILDVTDDKKFTISIERPRIDPFR